MFVALQLSPAVLVAGTLVAFVGFGLIYEYCRCKPNLLPLILVVGSRYMHNTPTLFRQRFHTQTIRHEACRTSMAVLSRFGPFRNTTAPSHNCCIIVPFIPPIPPHLLALPFSTLHGIEGQVDRSGWGDRAGEVQILASNIGTRRRYTVAPHGTNTVPSDSSVHRSIVT